MSVRWTERDPLSVEIQMTGERWRHILEKHKTNAPTEDEVRSTIRKPNAIYQSLMAPERQFFFRRVHEPGRKAKYVKAVVIKTRRPFIATSHYCKDHNSREEVKLIWIGL